jgi:hypothetical protein
VPALGDHRGQILRVGMVTIEIETQTHPDVIMAIDEHRAVLFDETKVSLCGPHCKEAIRRVDAMAGGEVFAQIRRALRESDLEA